MVCCDFFDSIEHVGAPNDIINSFAPQLFSCCLAAKLLKTNCKAAVLSQDSLLPTSLPLCVYLSVVRRVFGFGVCGVHLICAFPCVFVGPDVEIYLPVHVLFFFPNRPFFSLPHWWQSPRRRTRQPGCPGGPGLPQLLPPPERGANWAFLPQSVRRWFASGHRRRWGWRGELFRMCSFLSLLLLTCPEIPPPPQMK